MEKLLLSLLLIINFHTSLDFIVYQEFSSNNSKIELLLSKKNLENDIVNFDQSQQSFSIEKFVQFYIKRLTFQYQIESRNLLGKEILRVQEYTFFNFKPILFQIVNHEISVQKSHCI